MHGAGAGWSSAVPDAVRARCEKGRARPHLPRIHDPDDALLVTSAGRRSLSGPGRRPLTSGVALATLPSGPLGPARNAEKDGSTSWNNDLVRHGPALLVSVFFPSPW